MRRSGLLVRARATVGPHLRLIATMLRRNETSPFAARLSASTRPGVAKWPSALAARPSAPRVMMIMVPTAPIMTGVAPHFPPALAPLAPIIMNVLHGGAQARAPAAQALSASLDRSARF